MGFEEMLRQMMMTQGVQGLGQQLMNMGGGGAPMQGGGMNMGGGMGDMGQMIAMKKLQEQQKQLQTMMQGMAAPQAMAGPGVQQPNQLRGFDPRRMLFGGV